MSEITIRHQNDGNNYLMGVGEFTLPTDHKLYYSDNVKGLCVCK